MAEKNPDSCSRRGAHKLRRAMAWCLFSPLLGVCATSLAVETPRPGNVHTQIQISPAAVAGWQKAQNSAEKVAAGRLHDAEHNNSYNGVWIVELDQPGLMTELRSQGMSMRQAQAQAATLKQQLARVEERVESQRQALAQDMGMELNPVQRFRLSMAGFAAQMSPEEAARLRQMPGVKGVYPDVEYTTQLDAGPSWIGAPGIWNGPAGLRSQGEGVVIGVIDGGINWDHPFFANIGADGYANVNPRGQEFGLCNLPEVGCNNKLIGVYDYTLEGTNGRGTTDHGSHVSSIAAGNRLNLSLGLPGGTSSFMLSGVAPHANIISYKVCDAGNDPNSSGSCSGAGIMAAIEQATLDQVDVINISLGTTAPLPQLPWTLNIPQVELDAREAGVIVVVAAGNLGSQEGTVSSSGHSPWVITAGNSTHNRLIGQTVTDLGGGDTTPPPDLVGAGNSGNTASRRIVHAADFGFPLCGSGPAELRTGCGAGSADPIQGTTNPFPPGTFNGEIVVCDRGVYGRVEKGFNVMEAGAAGMILANTAADGADIVSDSHCLPSVHIDNQQGDALRQWLASGTNHNGRITATSRVLDDRFANQLAPSSSRGPNPEIPGVVKPNMTAPGTNIIGASLDSQAVAFLSGTSMASPHIAGSAALLLGVNPAWSPDQVQSTLETTTAHDVIEENGRPSPINSRGAGLVQPTNAVNAGLYLAISADDFRAANPQFGGDPAQLNLALLQETRCFQSCQFTRRVTDLQGGGNWTVRTEGELSLSVSPSQFSLGNGQSQTLTITADTSNPGLIGRWVEGVIVLESPGAPTQRLQATVMASGGDLPELVQLTTNTTRGRGILPLSGLTRIDHGNWDAGTLVPGELEELRNVSQDPTRSDPYDSPAGTRWILEDVPADTAYLLAQVLQSTASDIDLFVGRDDNGNGVPDQEEQLCSSTTTSAIERCILQRPQAGRYWLLFQNWDAGGSASSNISTERAVVPATNSGNFFVNGPGRVAANSSFNLDVGWDEGRMQRNQSWWSALRMGTDENNTGNLGTIPVRLARNGDDPGNTLPLFNERPRNVSVRANGEQGRMFIDVPPGASRLELTMSAPTGVLEAVRVPFNQAFSAEPFVPSAPIDRPFSQTVNGQSASLVITGTDLQAGRWYVIPRNTGASEISAEVVARLTLGNPGFTPQRNSFGPINRNVSQGVEFNRVGNNFGAAFFTYADDGTPVTYLGAGALGANQGLLAHGPLSAFVGIPGAQQAMPVGYIGLTFLSATEVILSYDLLGESGSEYLGTIAQLNCPQQNGQQLNVTGHWTPQTAGGGGTALLVNQNNQAYVFYFFDQEGIQRWLLANSPDNYTTSPLATARQFRGYCPTCPPSATGQNTVGTISHIFSSNNQGQQIIDVNLAPPLQGSVNFTRNLFKLTDANVCQ